MSTKKPLVFPFRSVNTLNIDWYIMSYDSMGSMCIAISTQGRLMPRRNRFPVSMIRDLLFFGSTFDSISISRIQFLTSRFVSVHLKNIRSFSSLLSLDLSPLSPNACTTHTLKFLNFSLFTIDLAISLPTVLNMLLSSSGPFAILFPLDPRKFVGRNHNCVCVLPSPFAT